MDTIFTIIAVTLTVIVCIAVLFGAVIGMCMLTEIPERRMFNEQFGTNYNAIEWCFAGGIIKDYIHKGEQKTLNVNLPEVVTE